MMASRSALLLSLMACASGGGAPVRPPSGSEVDVEALSEDRIEFHIETKHAVGPVRCALYTSEKAWLSSRYAYKDTAWPVGRRATCIFEDVPPGTYAGSGYHDENDNSAFDRNLFGLPSEDFTFTSGAQAGLGPPSFEDASFRYEGGVLRTSGRM